jgi:hypothetical protein
MNETVDRACCACPNIWTGGMNCPDCGEPGEPLRTEGETDE